LALHASEEFDFFPESTLDSGEDLRHHRARQ